MAPAETQPDSSRRMYNARADVYDDSHHPKFALDFLNLVKLKPGDRVLDLACGTGLVTIAAADRVAPNGFVFGVDISDKMLSEAQKKVDSSERGQIVSLANHSITELPSLAQLRDKQGTFDYVTCCSALVLLEDPVAALKQWISFLKPGKGRLVVDAVQAGAQPQGYLLELAVKALGLPMYYNRTWATGEVALRQKLYLAEGIKIEQCVLQRQLDFETREFDGGEEEGGKQFDAFAGREAYAYLFKDHSDRIEALRNKFIELWVEEAQTGGVLGLGLGGKGVVVEQDGVWTAVVVRA